MTLKYLYNKYGQIYANIAINYYFNSNVYLIHLYIKYIKINTIRLKQLNIKITTRFDYYLLMDNSYIFDMNLF